MRRHVVLIFVLGLGTILPLRLGTLVFEQQPRRHPDIPFVPSPPAVVDGMLKLARVTKDDVVYDLGSGDGRIVIAAAQNYGARGVGIDLDPTLIAKANRHAQKAGVADRVKFIEGDIFEASIADANVVTLFLLDSMNEKLRPKLIAELQPGTRIVSHAFGMGHWPPDQQAVVAGRVVFLWRVPKR